MRAAADELNARLPGLDEDRVHGPTSSSDHFPFRRGAGVSRPTFVYGLPRRPEPLSLTRRGTDQWVTTLRLQLVAGRPERAAYGATAAPASALL